MGLIDKVLNTNVKKDKNPLEYKNSLLRKAENVLSGDNPDNTNTEYKKKKIKLLIDSFFSEIYSDEFNLTIPIKTFNFYKQSFGLVKGAVLFSDESSNIFLPWISTGYDRTTSSRLRLSLADLTSFADNSFSRPFFIPKSNKSFLKKYFSSREHGLLDDILIIPYSDNNNNLVAFIIVTELSSFFTTYEDLLKYSAFFLKKSKSTIINFCSSRKKVKDSSLYLTKDSIMKEVSSYSKENKKNKIFFILFINAESIVKKLFSLSNDIITTGFSMEIYRIFSALTQNGGKIFILPDNSFFLIINSSVLIDKELLKHQISILLRNLVPDFNDTNSDFINIFSYPADTGILEDFINV